jgi:isopentenyl phosphate kinase
MTSEEIMVLKLGGSLLTDKSVPYKLREGVLDAVATEIKECISLGLIKSLVIIHGVGSFGHPPVLKYNLHRGFKDKSQLIFMSKTQQIVNELRKSIAAKFLEKGIPVNLMHASSLLVGDKMVITNPTFESLKGFLSLEMVPLIGGDMMYDKTMGFSVCSGDQIAVVLSSVIKAKRLMFATDVPGVYDQDPKSGKDAQLLKNLNIGSLDQLIKKLEDSGKMDASGRMQGKLRSLVPLKNQIKEGLEVVIFSMKKRDTLKRYLKGEEVDLTEIVID